MDDKTDGWIDGRQEERVYEVRIEYNCSYIDLPIHNWLFLI